MRNFTNYLYLSTFIFVFQACGDHPNIHSLPADSSDPKIDQASDEKQNRRIEMINESLSLVGPSPKKLDPKNADLKSFFHLASVSAPESASRERPQATGFDSYKDYVYVVYNTAGEKLLGGFDVLDVSNPKSPKIVFSSIYEDAEFADVAVDGKHAYAIGANADGAFLRVFSIDKKSMGKIVDEISFDGFYATSIQLDKKDIYVSVGSRSGIYKLSLSSLGSKAPEIKLDGFYELENAVHTLVNKENVYALGGRSSLSVYELNEKEIIERKEITKVSPEAPIRGFLKSGLLYLNPNESGLYVYRTNDREKEMSLVSHIEVEGTGNGLFVEDDYAYLAQGDAGVQVYTLSESNEPRRVGKFDFKNDPGSTNAVKYVESKKCKYLFIADGRGGFQIVQMGPFSKAPEVL